MKIAFISQPWNRIAPPVGAGSVAILTYETARRLAVAHEVTIFSKRDPDQAEEEVLDGVKYRRVPVERHRLWDRVWHRQLARVRALTRSTRPHFSSSDFHRGYISGVAGCLKDIPSEVVQIFNFSQFAPVIREANPRAKIVLRMSCEWLTQLDPAIIEPRLETIDAIFGCSEFITDRIRKSFPRFSNRCLTIHNGRDVDMFGVSPGRDSEVTPPGKGGGPRIIFVGRISPEKGIHVLVEAFQRVSERIPNVTLDIIGPNAVTPEEFSVSLTTDPKVKALARYYDMDYLAHVRSSLSPALAGQVRFRGSVPHQQLRHEYQTADLLVFPSIWDEPSGNPPIEAMAASVAVVSTRTGGTPEYVEDGVTGLLVDPDDPDQLACGIVRLLEDSELRERMGQAGREKALREFSYERFVTNLYGLFTTLTQRR